jgi:hypothetical protein
MKPLDFVQISHLERFTLGLRTMEMNLEGSATQRGLARSVLANVPCIIEPRETPRDRPLVPWP